MSELITSYAQNGEDVVLWRAFKTQKTGFYVDVGAASPVQHSVTKLFYDKGWNGINIEPIKRLHEQLVSQRQRDINLQLVLGAQSGEVTLHVFPTLPGLTTTDDKIAATHQKSGLVAQKVIVQKRTLTSVLEEHCSRHIDFLKIDVEGTEAEVLASFDLHKWRPRVLIIEATEPRSTIPSHQKWESNVLLAGYKMVLFDNLNRFYVRSDEPPSFVKALSKPASKADNFKTIEISKQFSKSLL